MKQSFVLKPVQINFIFIDNVGVCMYYVYCSKIKTSKITAKLSVRAETSNILIDFNGVLITSVSSHHSTMIQVQNHTMAGQYQYLFI